MKHRKPFSTPEQVIAKLKQAAGQAQDAVDKARKTLRKHGVECAYKEIKYRTLAPGFKVRDCEWRGNRWSFDPLTMEARSYNWWAMLTVHRGKLVRNDCGYSPQTSKHQSSLDRALEALGIKPDLVVYTRAPIQHLDQWKAAELGEFAERTLALKYCQKKSREHCRTWLMRKLREMKRLERAGIGLKFSDKDKAEALTKAEELRKQRLAGLRWRRDQVKQRQMAVNESTPARVEAPETKTHLSVVKP